VCVYGERERERERERESEREKERVNRLYLNKRDTPLRTLMIALLAGTLKSSHRLLSLISCKTGENGLSVPCEASTVRVGVSVRVMVRVLVRIRVGLELGLEFMVWVKLFLSLTTPKPPPISF
jgi:hypothetical protein